MENTDSTKDLSMAKTAYQAYIKQTGGVSLISGDKLPEFEALKDSIKAAWTAAALAVVDEFSAQIRRVSHQFTK